MTPPRWYSIPGLARATGLPPRHIRHLLDRGRVSFVQYGPNEKRLLNDATVADLEALGIPVDRGELGKHGENGEIRAPDDETGD